MISFSNPDGVHAPQGLYSHTATVPADTDLVFVSGQVGVRPDGSTPGTMGEQADQAFANVVALLRAHALEPTDIVKLTTFIERPGRSTSARTGRLRRACSSRS
jgi:enamine deaminase RidA (YjgF/YER057c/UK114 family)